jgi:hypothetical protein
MTGARALRRVLAEYGDDVQVADVTDAGRGCRASRAQPARLTIYVPDDDARAYRDGADRWVLVRIPEEVVRDAESLVKRPLVTIR